MKVEILDGKTFELIESREEEPTHDDTCDRCGECLRCCGPQACETAVRESDLPYEHRWVRYADVEPDPRAGQQYEYP